MLASCNYNSKHVRWQVLAEKNDPDDDDFETEQYFSWPGKKSKENSLMPKDAKGKGKGKSKKKPEGVVWKVEGLNNNKKPGRISSR